MTEQMMHLVMQLGLIILCAFGGGRAARRLGLPAVLGELTIGMLIGPYFLGGFSLPGFPNGIFPMTGEFPVSTELFGMTTVGSILLLFVVGIETDLNLFLRFSVAGLAVGFGGALVSFVLGDACTVFFFQFVLGRDIHFLSAIPLFMGVISSATSVGISARILSENDRVGSPEGVTILSGAVIDDILGVLMLSMVVAVSQSGKVEWGHVGGTALAAILTWLGVTIPGLLLVRWLGKFFNRIRDVAMFSIVCLGVAMVVSGLFEHAGLAMIIGAYVVGLALSQTPLAFVVQSQLAMLYKLLIPVFFCVMGMLIDFRSFGEPRIALFGILYTLAAIAAKLLGCSIPSLFLGFSGIGALRIGLGMIPRGEVALIISAIGLSSGILTNDVFAVAMIMTVASTLFTPYLLVLSIRNKKPSLRDAGKEPSGEMESLVLKMPSSSVADLFRSRLVDFLRREDFNVNVIDFVENVYHVYRDDFSMTVKVPLNTLIINCKSNDLPLVKAVLLELFSGLDRILREFQSCVRSREILKTMMMPDVKSPETRPFPLSPLRQIKPYALECDLKGKTKEEVLDELLSIMVRVGDLKEENRRQARIDLLDRERGMSTGLQNGIALPHCKTDAVEQLCAVFGLHREGIDFEAMDGNPCHLFVLILSPKSRPGEYLKFVAGLSLALSDSRKRQELLSARDNRTLYRLLAES
jgi:Kef-type K+ transport system membrane component KefB/mannitol/fructose-specific phosphotransferase system IIA component (Ntr-type)